MEFKEKLFLLLSGIFTTALVLGNVIGTTKFVYVFGLVVPAGVLAYPFTFLATNLVSVNSMARNGPERVSG